MYDPLMERLTTTVALKAFFINPFILYSSLTANIKHKYKGTSTKNKCGAVTLKNPKVILLKCQCSLFLPSVHEVSSLTY